MINLEDLDYNDDTKELRADFGGFLEDGFYIECEIDYDEDVEKAEPEIGIMNDYSTFSNFTFWYFKIYNSANEEVSFSDRVVKEIKEEMEYELKRQMEKH